MQYCAFISELMDCIVLTVIIQAAVHYTTYSIHLLVCLRRHLLIERTNKQMIEQVTAQYDTVPVLCCRVE